MKESGAINRFLAHLIFVGLPESGKTTFIARLLSKEGVDAMLKASESTGVMNGIITVNVSHDKASLHTATVDESNCEWQEVDFGLSCLGQMGKKYFVSRSDQTPENSTPLPAPSSQQSQSEDVSPPNIVPLPSVVLPSVQKNRTPSSINTTAKHMEVIKRKMENGFSTVRPLLENKSTLYLSDTGMFY